MLNNRRKNLYFILIAVLTISLAFGSLLFNGAPAGDKAESLSSSSLAATGTSGTANAYITGNTKSKIAASTASSSAAEAASQAASGTTASTTLPSGTPKATAASAYSTSMNPSGTKSVSATAKKKAPILPSSLLPKKIVAGYYSSWSAYSGYTPDKINASKIDVIHYAFAGIGSDYRITAGDTAVDYANFTKLNAIKKNRPHLKTLISVGGWGNSSRFSAMAMTDYNRNIFAKSCVNFIKQYGFDGADIDWEYPVSGGCAGRPEDKVNFTLLMKKLREELNAQALLDGRYYYLTFAGGASNSFIGNVQTDQLANYVDYAVDMTYDLHGPWDSRADLNAPLYTPTESSPQYKISADSSLKLWLNAGFPADKLVMGIPFYGYVYDGAGSENGGLYQNFTSAQAAGYDRIASSYLNNPTFTKFFHPVGQVPYLYGSGKFISYDDPDSIAKKARYAAQKGLRGISAWELGYDKASALLTSAYDNFK